MKKTKIPNLQIWNDSLDGRNGRDLNLFFFKFLTKEVSEIVHEENESFKNKFEPVSLQTTNSG